MPDKSNDFNEGGMMPDKSNYDFNEGSLMLCWYCNALFIYLIILLENIVYYYILYDFLWLHDVIMMCDVVIILLFNKIIYVMFLYIFI